MNDPYDNGISKYSTAADIYDALRELIQTEEMGILQEIGMNVSWENQTYYYTDKGGELLEEFEKLSDHGRKIWLLDLAIDLMDGFEIHELVYRALCNDDLAKRIGFKKLFTECMLHGDAAKYEKVAQDFLDEIGELNRFDNYSMRSAFNKTAEENGISLYNVTPYPNLDPYPNFAVYLKEKVQNLRMEKETRLIAGCRAHLTAYDDFIFGLRVNQALHEQLEQMYQSKVAALQAAYNEKVETLQMAAERAGLAPALAAGLQRLGSGESLLKEANNEDRAITLK